MTESLTRFAPPKGGGGSTNLLKTPHGDTPPPPLLWIRPDEACSVWVAGWLGYGWLAGWLCWLAGYLTYSVSSK